MNKIANFEPDLVGIAERIKQLLKQYRINSKQLAEILEVSSPTISNIINAKTLISSDILIKAANYFKVTTDYILTGESKITDNLLYRHQEISQEIQTRIKDIEEKYKSTEINDMIKELPTSTKKTSILDLLKIVITIQKGSDEKTIQNLINQVDDETYDLLKRLNTEFIESHQKEKIVLREREK